MLKRSVIVLAAGSTGVSAAIASSRAALKEKPGGGAGGVIAAKRAQVLKKDDKDEIKKEDVDVVKRVEKREKETNTLALNEKKALTEKKEAGETDLEQRVGREQHVLDPVDLGPLRRHAHGSDVAHDVLGSFGLAGARLA